MNRNGDYQMSTTTKVVDDIAWRIDKF